MTDNLTNLISQAVVATMTPEFVEREVKTRVERLITESINSALRSYSDTGKLIEKAVQDALKIDRLDLPEHLPTEVIETGTLAQILAAADAMRWAA